MDKRTTWDDEGIRSKQQSGRNRTQHRKWHATNARWYFDMISTLFSINMLEHVRSINALSTFLSITFGLHFDIGYWHFFSPSIAHLRRCKGMVRSPRGRLPPPPSRFHLPPRRSPLEILQVLAAGSAPPGHGPVTASPTAGRRRARDSSVSTSSRGGA